MRPHGPRGPRTLQAAAGLAVALVTAWASLDGLTPAPFTDGSLDLAWRPDAESSGGVQARAAAGLLGLLRALTLSAAAVAMVTVGLLAAGSAAGLRPEAATRAALGADRRSLARWAAGGPLAAAPRWAGAGLVSGLFVATLCRSAWPGSGTVFPGPATLAWAVAGAGLVAALAAGLPVAALALTPRDLSRAMGATSVLPRYPAGLRWTLPAAQLAVAGGLLAGAGLLLQEGGPAGVRGGEPAPPGVGGPGAGTVMAVRLEGASPAARVRRLQARLRQVGEETGAAVAAATPGAFLGLGPRDLALAECGRCSIGGLAAPIQNARVRHHAVSPDTFLTLGVAVVEGREFGPGDRAGAPPVAVVNRAFARAVFHDGGPVGRHVRLGGELDGWYRVVGVVDGETQVPALGADHGPAVFLSALQHPPARVDLFVPGVDPAGTPAAGVESLGVYTARHGAPLVWAGWVAGGLGAVSLLLAVSGLGAVMRFVAERRQRELGLRAALGADGRALGRRVVAEAARLVGAGMLGAAWTATLVVGLTGGHTGAPGLGAFAAVVGVAAVLVTAGLVGALAPAHEVAAAEPAAVLNRY